MAIGYENYIVCVLLFQSSAIYHANDRFSYMCLPHDHDNDDGGGGESS